MSPVVKARVFLKVKLDIKIVLSYFGEQSLRLRWVQSGQIPELLQEEIS